MAFKHEYQFEVKREIGIGKPFSLLLWYITYCAESLFRSKKCPRQSSVEGVILFGIQSRSPIRHYDFLDFKFSILEF